MSAQSKANISLLPTQQLKKMVAMPVNLLDPGIQVLVVDDDADTVDTMAVLLETFGVAVDRAYDAGMAIELVKSSCPDLVLLDLGMPYRSGYDVARAVPSMGLPREPFLVAVSGFAQTGDKRRCVEEGFDLFITKPVDYSAFVRLLLLFRDSKALRNESHRLQAQNASLYASFLKLYLDMARNFLSVAATTQVPATRERCMAKANRARDLIIAQLGRSPASAAQWLLDLVLQDVLDRALVMEASIQGNIQLLNRDGATEIASQKGCPAAFLQYFSTSGQRRACVCSRAIREHRLLAIADVNEDPLFDSYREMAAAANFRAVCSSPLVAPGGRLLGVLCIHFNAPRGFSAHELQRRGDYAEQAAAFITWALD